MIAATVLPLVASDGDPQKAVAAAAAVGISGIVLVLALQRWLPKVPSVLVMVVLAIGATSLFGLADRGVSLVGELPQGFPPFTIPSLDFSDFALMFAGAKSPPATSTAPSTRPWPPTWPRPGPNGATGTDSQQRGVRYGPSQGPGWAGCDPALLLRPRTLL